MVLLIHINYESDFVHQSTNNIKQFKEYFKISPTWVRVLWNFDRDSECRLFKLS
eukprot:m.265081 g.265081  ORF g.265081 m.265081 type:complete len:54 (-) comp15626_c1_seq1:197-358(-)